MRACARPRRDDRPGIELRIVAIAHGRFHRAAHAAILGRDRAVAAAIQNTRRAQDRTACACPPRRATASADEGISTGCIRSGIGALAACVRPLAINFGSICVCGPSGLSPPGAGIGDIDLHARDRRQHDPVRAGLEDQSRRLAAVGSEQRFAFHRIEGRDQVRVAGADAHLHQTRRQRPCRTGSRRDPPHEAPPCRAPGDEPPAARRPPPWEDRRRPPGSRFRHRWTACRTRSPECRRRARAASRPARSRFPAPSPCARAVPARLHRERTRRWRRTCRRSSRVDNRQAQASEAHRPRSFSSSNCTGQKGSTQRRFQTLIVSQSRDIPTPFQLYAPQPSVQPLVPMTTAIRYSTAPARGEPS